jgi:hypothetical protein
LPAPGSPTGLAVTRDGRVLVVGELASEVARYRVRSGRLEPDGAIAIEGVRAMRDVAVGPEGVAYVVEEHDGRLITFQPPRAGTRPEKRVDATLCHGPVHVRRVGASLLVDCLLDHAVVVRPVDAHGYPRAEGEARIVHDGPMWGMDAIADGGGLLVAVGGVEDHPLDRTEGSFGFVDSFVTLYRVEGTVATKLVEVNTSELGVVTPKALALSRSASGELDLAAAAYGSDRVALLHWSREPRPGDPAAAPSVATIAAPPGSAALERGPDGTLAIANPLLDAWVTVSAEGPTVTPVRDDASRARSTDSRLGEALFFTTLMAPWDRSDGRLSRFTCETCHFEGYVDGRTHFTGRGTVRATTKPLLGLFNNRPHFSRALDPDMATMVNNEFRVAGAKSDHDPWFSLEPADFPWIQHLAVGRDALGPEELRRALMTFLMDFMPRPNPSVVGRTRWVDAERAGAAIFRDRCESCHQARLVADEPESRVPFDRWEGLVMTREGPIVWGRDGYEKTGVEPYVNEKGARVVSLRRLYKKYPYFTNGSAKSLADVLDRVRLGAGQFFHDQAPDGADALAPGDKEALASFLDLL